MYAAGAAGGKSARGRRPGRRAVACPAAGAEVRMGAGGRKVRGGPLSPCGIRGAAAVLGVLLGLQAARGLPALFAENGPPPGDRSPAGPARRASPGRGPPWRTPPTRSCTGRPARGSPSSPRRRPPAPGRPGRAAGPRGCCCPRRWGWGRRSPRRPARSCSTPPGSAGSRAPTSSASACGGLAASAAAALFCSLARRADLDPRVVPLVLGTAGLGLVIPAAGVLARRVSAPRPGPGSGPRPAS